MENRSSSLVLYETAINKTNVFLAWKSGGLRGKKTGTRQTDSVTMNVKFVWLINCSLHLVRF